MTNKYQDHLWIVPEDDADRQLAIGFVQHPAIRLGAVQVLPVAGGWRVARGLLARMVPELQKFARRRVLLLVDFDEDPTRRAEMLRDVPDELHARVFVLGVWSNPERLKADLGGRRLEYLGEDLADACVGQVDGLWAHALLAHNRDEVERLRREVGSFLM